MTVDRGCGPPYNLLYPTAVTLQGFYDVSETTSSKSFKNTAGRAPTMMNMVNRGRVCGGQWSFVKIEMSCICEKLLLVRD